MADKLDELHMALRRVSGADSALMAFDLAGWAAYPFCMNAVEFTTELSGTAVLSIPREIAAQLPKSGKARIIVLTDEAIKADLTRRLEDLVSGKDAGLTFNQVFGNAA